MIITEEEAKTKRCQEGFPGQPLGSGYVEAREFPRAGEHVAVTTPIYCIGSNCMAWCWKDGIARINKRQLDDMFGIDFITVEDYLPLRLGYCGKAGAG